MKITTSLLLTASLFCFLGCTETKKETSSETATAESLELESPATVSGEVTDLDPDNLQATMEINDPNAPAAPAPTTVTTGPGLNPPHGQPGHDCAIAVGAPLNSKGTKATAPQIQTSPQSSSSMGAPTLSVPPVSTTAPGLNPPHGQPGHDCAIAVGAPLKK